MDRRQTEFAQPGLNTYPTFPEPPSEGTPADQASAAQYPQDNSASARSGSFPEYIQRSYQPGAQGANAGMAQPQSPSMPLQDGQANDHQQQLKSDDNVPIDPSIAAASSPTYPQHGQYSPYTPHSDMQHYPGHPTTPMYAQRPEWAGQYPQHPVHYGHPATSGPPGPAMISPVQRPPTVGVCLQPHPRGRPLRVLFGGQCCGRLNWQIQCCSAQLVGRSFCMRLTFVFFPFTSDFSSDKRGKRAKRDIRACRVAFYCEY